MEAAVLLSERPLLESALSLAVALAVGLLLGIERERHHPRVAGVRTFGIVSLFGCVAAALSPWLLLAAVLVTGALVAVGYWGAQNRDRGATSEVALAATPLLGGLAWYNPTIASALAVVITVLLASKGRLHTFARKTITDREVDDALVFFVAAVVILPLLPSGEWGPYGALDLRRIWWIVVALAAVGWAGYIATRALGPRRGLLVTGLAGGFVSASATIGAMCRRAREPGLFRPAMGAAIVANAATLIQLEIVVAVVAPAMALELLPAAIAGVVTIAVLTAILMWRAPEVPDDSYEQPRPLQWRPILLVALILVAATLIARWAEAEIGASGVLGVAAITGLADAHAGGLAAANLLAAGQLELSLAATAAAVALATNLGTKIVLAFAAGGWRPGAIFTALVMLPTAVVAVALVLTL